MHKELGNDAFKAGIKDRSAAADKFYSSSYVDRDDGSRQLETTFEAIKNDPKTYAGLSAIQMAKQKNLDELIDKRDKLTGKPVIDQTMAVNMLANETALAEMGLDNIAKLQRKFEEEASPILQISHSSSSTQTPAQPQVSQPQQPAVSSTPTPTVAQITPSQPPATPTPSNTPTVPRIEKAYDGRVYQKPKTPGE